VAEHGLSRDLQRWRETAARLFVTSSAVVVTRSNSRARRDNVEGKEHILSPAALALSWTAATSRRAPPELLDAARREPQRASTPAAPRFLIDTAAVRRRSGASRR